MSKDEKLEYIQLLEEKQRRKKFSLIDTYFPDTGPLRRELYPKHLQFFKEGKDFDERLALCANRVGKTETMGGYEVVCHLTGLYPHWWNGRRFNRPTEWWAAGKTGQTVRDILQKKLLGPKHAIGTGLIKPELIKGITPRSGIPEAVDTIRIKHISGGISELGFKSYDQKRQSFEGTKKDGIWMDEEPSLEIYAECVMRTTDTSGTGKANGLVIMTFTPLLGMSETVLQFLPSGEIQERSQDSKTVIMATWDDAPHLNQAVKEKMLASIPPFQRDARTKGVPQLGSGAIYPVSEDTYLVDPFQIPKHFPRAYGFDVGWNRTAAIWGARDLESDIIYLYSEHYLGEEKPIVHADSIKGRGDWIPGVIDPASHGRSQEDGRALFDKYRAKPCSLDIEHAANAVETGIYAVWERLSAGKLKVFRNLEKWKGEVRLYRRDEKGKIVKKNDHLMDATRYLIMSGIDRMKAQPVEQKQNIVLDNIPLDGGGWMG